MSGPHRAGASYHGRFKLRLAPNRGPREKERNHQGLTLALALSVPAEVVIGGEPPFVSNSRFRPLSFHARFLNLHLVSCSDHCYRLGCP
jgi:hypothetical protein